MILDKYTLNCNGQLVWLEDPAIMGILNITPDSFYEASRVNAIDQALAMAESMIKDGATFIDIGGTSSRPGAGISKAEEELRRVLPIIRAIHDRFPDTIISVDTYHSLVAKESVSAGASIVNDISAGRIDEAMYQTVADLEIPYVLMHMSGDPTNMQVNPIYDNVTLSVLDFFIEEIGKLRQLLVKDIIIDPGFGFGKTIEHNYQLLNGLHTFRFLECVVLAGISRKSMIYKALDISPELALNGTTALHMKALDQGAKILRVHDVKEAVECVKLWKLLQENPTPSD